MSTFDFVSLVGLIARPEAYEGRTVTVVGYVVAAGGSSGAAIYLSELDQQNGVTKNALWLDCEPGQASNEGYCIVEGAFSHFLGPSRSYSGSLNTITRIQEWRR